MIYRWFISARTEYLVTKIRFPEDENAEQPDAAEQEITNTYRSVAELSMTRTMKTKPAQKQSRERTRKCTRECHQGRALD